MIISMPFIIAKKSAARSLLFKIFIQIFINLLMSSQIDLEQQILLTLNL